LQFRDPVRIENNNDFSYPEEIPETWPLQLQNRKSITTREYAAFGVRGGATYPTTSGGRRAAWRTPRLT